MPSATLSTYSVTMFCLGTGESFTVATEARDTEHAEKIVRGIYGRPGWDVSCVQREAVHDGS